jgi:hypothetical protein
MIQEVEESLFHKSKKKPLVITFYELDNLLLKADILSLKNSTKETPEKYILIKY